MQLGQSGQSGQSWQSGQSRQSWQSWQSRNPVNQGNQGNQGKQGNLNYHESKLSVIFYLPSLSDDLVFFLGKKKILCILFPFSAFVYFVVTLLCFINIYIPKKWHKGNTTSSENPIKKDIYINFIQGGGRFKLISFKKILRF